MNEPSSLTVGMIAFPGMMQLDFTGPYEVFSLLPRAEVRVLAPSLEPVRSETGLRILPDAVYDASFEFDLVFVPGGRGVTPLLRDEAFLSFLQAIAERARFVTAVCTGSLLLGAAGLLRGCRATTYWLMLDLLEIVGATPVRERVVIDRNRITGGGVTAGIDFALTVAAHLYGQTTAERIQLALEYNPAPPFQSGSPDTASPVLVEQITTAMRKPIEERRALLQQRMAEIEK